MATTHHIYLKLDEQEYEHLKTLARVGRPKTTLQDYVSEVLRKHVREHARVEVNFNQTR